MEALLEARGIEKAYGGLTVLRGVDIDVHAGEMVALVGTSGAGKTTLLQVVSTLDLPGRGELRFDGQDLRRLSRNEQAAFRNRELGFVFQFHHLMAEFTALENVCIPAFIAGMPRREAEARARQLLDEFGVAGRAGHKPPALSGGEAQRVAVARALINQPRLILADEPTGNLDSDNRRQMISTFRALAAERNVAVLVATHNEAFAEAAGRVLRIRDGRMLAMEAADA